jgi:hypothetical protein
MKLLLLLSVFVGLGWSQTADHEHTVGLTNGRYWTTLNRSEQLGFEVGYSEAWHTLHGWKTDSDGFPKNVTIGEVVTGLNQYYSAPENLIVPVSTALRFWTKKFQGEDPMEWAKELAESIRYWHLSQRS